MTGASNKKRVDTASTGIEAPPLSVYKAFTDAALLLAWLPPAGMTGRILAFEPRVGGRFDIALTYNQFDGDAPGKTTTDTDVVRGRFQKLAPGKQVVQLIEFESDDPTFGGKMTMTWTLEAVPEGTKVTVVCENVPAGIREEDHVAGLRESLGNLATFFQRRRGRPA